MADALPEVGVKSAAAAASGAGPLGALISGAFGFLGGESTNSANAAIAQKQMDFQERMSSTAYQRAVKDLRKAGLSPMLAYSQGGASSPGGAGFQAVNSTEAGNQAASGYMARKVAEEQSALMQDQQEQTEAETSVKKETAKGLEKDNKLKDFAIAKAVLEQPYYAGHAAVDLDTKFSTLKKIVQETDTSGANKAVLLKSLDEIASRIKLQSSSASQADQTTKKLEHEAKTAESESKLRQFDVDAAEKWSNMGRGAKEIKPILDALMLILRGK